MYHIDLHHIFDMHTVREHSVLANAHAYLYKLNVNIKSIHSFIKLWCLIFVFLLTFPVLLRWSMKCLYMKDVSNEFRIPFDYVLDCFL